MNIPNAPAYVTTRVPILGPVPAWRETIYPMAGVAAAMRYADQLKREGHKRVRVRTAKPDTRRYLVQEIAATIR